MHTVDAERKGGGAVVPMSGRPSDRSTEERESSSISEGNGVTAHRLVHERGGASISECVWDVETVWFLQ